MEALTALTQSAGPVSLLAYSERQPWLVGLSILMSVLACTMALQVASHGRWTQRPFARRTAIGSGAIALALGIWSMYFISLEAIRWPYPVAYHWQYIALALLPALLSTWALLRLLTRGQVQTRDIVVCGVLVTLGIASMQYAGFAAMLRPVPVTVHPWKMLAAVTVSLLLSIAAIWFRLAMRRRRRVKNDLPLAHIWISGVVLGLAVAGVQMLLWMGLEVSPVAPTLTTPLPEPGWQTRDVIAYGIALSTAFLLLLVAAGNHLLRFQELLRQASTSETRLRSTLNTLTDAVVLFNAQGQVLNLNPAGIRLFGWSLDEARALKATDLLGSDAGGSLTRLAPPGATHSPPQERQARRKDGRFFPVLLSVGEILLPEARCYVAQVSDLSQRKAMEQALFESEARMRSLVRNTPGMAFSIRLPERDTSYVSDGAKTLTGWTAADFMVQGQRILDMVHPGDREETRRLLRQALREEGRFETEFRLIHRLGHVVWIMARGAVVHDAQGQVQSFDGLLLDITEQKLAEIALRENEARMRTLVANIPGVVLRSGATAPFQVYFVSDAIRGLTGWPAQAFIQGTVKFADLLLPGEAARAVALRDGAIRDHTSYDAELCLRHRDGHEVWVQVRGRAEYDAKQNPKWVDSVLLDITRAKQLEQQAKEREDRFSSLITNLPGIVMRRRGDERRSVSFISDSAESILGWPVNAFIKDGLRMRDLIHEEDLEHAIKALDDCLHTSKTFVHTVRMRHREGHYLWLRTHGYVVDDEHGIRWIDSVHFDVSDAMTLELALKEQQKQFKTLVSNIPGVVFRLRMDEHLSPVFVSQGMPELVGWQPEDFVAGRVSILGAIHPDDLAGVSQAVLAATPANPTNSLQFRWRHKDGHYVWISLQNCAVFGADGTIAYLDGVVFDITETHKNQEALRASEQLSRTLIANTPCVMVRVSPDWTPLYVSDAVSTMFGWHADDFMQGRAGFLNLLHPDDLAAATATAQEAIRTKHSFNNYHRFIHRDGHIVHTLFSGTPALDASGKVLSVDGILIDLTERFEMEQALRDAKDAAERAAESKSTFLANMSHEIRTPLNAVIGFSELLLGTGLDEQQRRYLTTVRNSARSLLGLLNDILDTAKLERNALELEQLDYSLKELCLSVVESFELVANKKKLSLSLEYASDLSDYMLGDALRMRQIITNLLSNAVKFTEKGTVKLVVERQDGQLHLAVHDTGIGIAPERLDSIFDPFAQADASTTRRFGGTGLGTTISRQLVTLMKGRLWAESRLGQGSSFHVLLPLAEGAPVVHAHEVTLFDMPVLHILAADDVPQNIELLSLILRNAGHQVTTVTDGAEAAEVFKRGMFDVVLMDVQMPGIDGLEATRLIRRFEQSLGRRATPIIALTASVLEEDRQATRAAGMDGFATKPIDQAALMQEIARVTSVAVAPLQAPQTQTASAAPAKAAGHVIDHAAGAALWGSSATHATAVARFAKDIAELSTRLTQQACLADTSELRQTAHKLRGMSANLCLPLLSKRLAALEAAAQKMDGPSVQGLMPEVLRALEDVAAAAAANAVPNGPAIAPAAHQSGSSEADTPQLLQALGRATMAQIQHGEFDEPAILRLTHAMHRLGHQNEADALYNALQDFEMDEAHNVLSSWLDTLLPR
ncbi:PAS domain-containing protein [Variovorax sp. HJSM1_2]|uniref:PAS domain-containing protein n=1 Tax=Variovorax sp. HJSM1_2 TaxID=3366263 RepID=UPI003BDD8A02